MPPDPGIPRIAGDELSPGGTIFKDFPKRSHEGPQGSPKGAKGSPREPKVTPRGAKEIPKGAKGAQSWPEGSHRHAKDTHGKPEGQDIYLKTPDQPHGGRYVSKITAA